MTENLKSSRVLVKEIQIDRGVFNIKSETTHKFSASESYKEQITKKGLPPEAPKDFKEAIPNLYYAPENRELISYTKLHQQINTERDLLLKGYESINEETKKKAQIESSKKVLKEYGINDKALMIYSPLISHYLNDDDEFSKISVTYNPEEKILFVKTELLPRERKKIPQEIVIGEMVDLFTPMDELLKKLNISSLPNASQAAQSENNETLEQNSTQTSENNQTVPQISPEEQKHQEEIHQKIESAKKVDIEELKKKYNFARPKTESISDIVKRTAVSHKSETHHENQNTSAKVSEQPSLKNLITEAMHNLPGKWTDNTYKVDYGKTGYLVPIQEIQIKNDSIYIRSSSITNTEWWTKFTPNHLCRRFEGALYIPDSYAPFCKEGKCNTACGAEDGFVELSAARFRLLEESEVIQEDFKRLQQFLDRCYKLIDEFKTTFGVDIKLDILSNRPFFYSIIDLPADDYVVRNYIESYMTLYPEVTDIRGNVDIGRFVLNEDYDPVSEDGLVQESRLYGLQEMVHMGAEDLLKNIVNEKDGKIDGNFYLIDNGRMRYKLKQNSIEAYREDLYMGNVTFKKGLKEVEDFLATTLGGGRW